MDIPVGILLFFLGFTIGIIVTVSFLKLKRRKVANPDSVGNQASIHAISPLHQQIQPVTKLKQCFMDIPYLKAYGYDSKAADIGYIERNQETMGKTIEERDIDHYDDIGSVSRNIAEERSHKNDMYFRLEPLEDTCI
ncbi:uncharacterized protein LOC133194857 [Saccostrea echinata]|uniref:uncharacterized protein LOC133194857 n=1 Tax=Saccostrea echinata TaxID=191078 RepID=UPI002A80A76D|nr:uncharacterized protein LOC133194857 [Saccostrea echinata]